MALLWFAFCWVISYGATHYGALALGIEGPIMSFLFTVTLAVSFDRIVEVEDQLPQWLQWVCRGLSMVFTVLFAYWATMLLVGEVLFVLKFLWDLLGYLALLWFFWMRGDLEIGPDGLVFLGETLPH